MTRKGWFWLAGAGAAGAAALLAAWLPGDDPSRTLCFTRRFLGVSCPGCGMTRAVAQLLHGNFGQALALHPLVPLAVADVVVGWGVWGLSLYGVVAPPSRRLIAQLLLAQLALLVAVWLGRAASGTLPY